MGRLGVSSISGHPDPPRQLTPTQQASACSGQGSRDWREEEGGGRGQRHLVCTAGYPGHAERLQPTLRLGPGGTSGQHSATLERCLGPRDHTGGGAGSRRWGGVRLLHQPPVKQGLASLPHALGLASEHTYFVN